MNGEWIVYLGAVIVAPAILLLVKKLLPSLTEYEELSEDQMSKLKGYAKYDFITFFILIVIGAPIGYGSWILFCKLGEFNAANFSSTLLSISADGSIWILPSGLIALTIAGISSTAILKKTLGNKFHEYVAYRNNKMGINEQKLEKPLVGLLVLLCVVFSVLALNWYTLFYSDKMIVNSFFSLKEKTFEYEMVEGIYTAPYFVATAGNEVQEREFVVFFKGGSQWTTQGKPQALSLEEKWNIARFIADNSRKKIVELSVLPESLPRKP